MAVECRRRIALRADLVAVHDKVVGVAVRGPLVAPAGVGHERVLGVAVRPGGIHRLFRERVYQIFRAAVLFDGEGSVRDERAQGFVGWSRRGNKVRRRHARGAKIRGRQDPVGLPGCERCDGLDREIDANLLSGCEVVHDVAVDGDESAA